VKPEAVIHFPPFYLDCSTGQLWQGSQVLRLRPKSFAVLRYLAEHPHRLVTKEELLKAVWPETYVSAGLLHTYIRDLRGVLGDNRQTPRFIATVARRGYRFIAPVERHRARVARPETVSGSHPPTPSTLHSLPHLVGRNEELGQLQSWWQKAVSGARQVVLVTGELGMGKTTVVEEFLRAIVTEETVWIGWGQCIEHYGAGEAYLPVLEALGRLCREPQGEHVVEVLRQYAPTWLVQMPALVSEEEFESLHRKVRGTTPERRLWELTEAMAVLTVERPLVLWLEDLQWSDYATLDLLSTLARRRDPARLLVLGDRNGQLLEISYETNTIY
jgi:DNA-binding winged helix-turn-helix (wHTH) protein